MNRNLTGIGFDRNLPPIILIFIIFKYMRVTAFSDESSPHLNTLQSMVSEVLMFHENTELLPSGNFYKISPGNNYTTKRITLVLVVITFRTQLYWVEAVKED